MGENERILAQLSRTKTELQELFPYFSARNGRKLNEALKAIASIEENLAAEIAGESEAIDKGGACG